MFTAFIAAFDAVQKHIHQTAVDKGWWDDELGRNQKRNDAEMIALMHSELSEALEGLRAGDPFSDKLGPPFTQVEEELADLFIRVCDYAAGRKLQLAEAIIAKMGHNVGRPYKHGGKKF
jgi:NTP pyrophosphatase (non-canonical NTP hydrolase)